MVCVAVPRLPQSYEPRYYYMEVPMLLYKLIMSAVVVVLLPTTVTQVCTTVNLCTEHVLDQCSYIAVGRLVHSQEGCDMLQPSRHWQYSPPPPPMAVPAPAYQHFGSPHTHTHNLHVQACVFTPAQSQVLSTPPPSFPVR